jgi:hypothetical protein
MPFTLRRYQRFPLYCTVTYRAGLVQSQGVLYGQNARDPQVLQHQRKRGSQRLLSTQNGHSQ